VLHVECVCLYVIILNINVDAGLVYYVVTANSMVAFVACCCVFVIFPEHKTGYKPLPSEAEDINGTTLETTDQLRPGP
jgi:hypothetical protein